MLIVSMSMRCSIRQRIKAGGAKRWRTPLPKIEIANPGQCVAPPEQMRRKHMDMLKHQRDRTLRAGIRGEANSLNACIDCHAAKTSGSVLGEGGFCQSCHAYAAVKLDCFECHQPRATPKPAATHSAAPATEVKQ